MKVLRYRNTSELLAEQEDAVVLDGVFVCLYSCYIHFFLGGGVLTSFWFSYTSVYFYCEFPKASQNRWIRGDIECFK